jgi:GNAT superfamily N-acetyltransferase
MIRPCNASESDAIWAIINDGARAYKGVIPADRWHEPYMPKAELRQEIKDGVVFWGYEQDGALSGVMGIQDVKDVTLIRHAYVRTTAQGQGIGGQLLSHLRKLAKNPLLIGTWADATWAIRFYQRQIPKRQIETSVVLASPEWLQLNNQASTEAVTGS